MSSRNKILQNIARAQYPEVTKPEIYKHGYSEQDVLTGFLDACRRNGTEIISVSDREEATKAYKRTVFQHESANDQLTALLVESTLGVAENGSVWLPEEALPDRVAPFACEHLCVLLFMENLVPTMHHAYQRFLDHASGNPAGVVSGFGVFIAGPSKTADIEQTLVTGAQGSKKHTLFLITSM
jgi:L-lactate dehydrogenase complex protein LldG